MSFIPTFEIGIWNAWLFMSIFLLQMLAIRFVDKDAWQRSHVPREVRRKKLERFAAIAGNLIWLIAMGYSVFLPLQLGTTQFYVGLTVCTFGLATMASATLKFIDTSEGQVISKGIYQYSRHPMYVATFFISLGAGIAAGSGLFILLSIMMAICFYQEALIEERYCLHRFGDTYREYMQRAPRLIGLPRKGGKGSSRLCR